MQARCELCSGTITSDAAGRWPPWCPVCGSSLKPDAVIVEELVDANGPADGDTLDNRFGLHNLIAGLILATVAFILGFLLDANPGVSKLKMPASLDRILSILQVLNVVTGIALFASGIGIRRRLTWGYPLAVVSASVLVLAGLAFFTVFYRLTQIDGLEHSVALFPFIWTNLDAVIGFVDGGGLLYFLFKFRDAIGLNCAKG